MKEKIEKQPHTKQQWAYHLSLRCGARRKYDGHPCQSPAVSGKKRCRLHGGAKGSGAPRGNRNALKHGFYTKEQISLRKASKRALSQKNMTPF